MQSLAQSPIQILRRVIDRIRNWHAQRQGLRPFAAALALNFPSHAPLIHRDVSSQGVRVYSLCGDCGARLQASATLCEECAQKRSAKPY